MPTATFVIIGDYAKEPEARTIANALGASVVRQAITVEVELPDLTQSTITAAIQQIFSQPGVVGVQLIPSVPCA